MPSDTSSQAHASRLISAPKRKTRGEFPSPHIRPPLDAQHKSTVIFLHGRGSNAEKFGDPLLAASAQRHGVFQTSFPHTRFVFPEAPLMRATKYRRSIIRQWYDGSGDWEPEARGNMRRSVEHILALMRAEIKLLDGDASKVVLAGMSQGCAMALTCFLLWDGDPLCAVVGMCGFMPITAPLIRILDGEDASIEQDAEDGFIFESDTLDKDSCVEASLEEPGVRSPVQEVVEALWEETELPGAAPQSSFSFRSTPVFLGHGVLDDMVNHLHTREAVELMTRLGVAVEFRTYPELGHWYSAEMLSDIVSFLAKHVDSKHERCLMKEEEEEEEKADA